MKNLFIISITALIISCGSVNSVSTDTTAPTISSMSIESDATGVALDASLTITFSEALDSTTLTTSNLTITPTSNGTLSICTAWSLDTATNTATCTHGDLAPGVAYTIRVTTNVTDSASNAIAEANTRSFTTTSTAGSNNPTAKIVIPSFAKSGGNTLDISFSTNMNSESFLTDSVKVTTTADTSTNLCSSTSYNDTTKRLTCTLSSAITCSNDPAKFLVTVSADPKASSGSHAVAPLTDYFSNLDNSFGNATALSTTEGEECWLAEAGEDNGSTVSGETLDFNTTNSGKLTIEGAPLADVTATDGNDSRPSVITVDTITGAFSAAVKISHVNGLDDQTQNAAIVIADESGEERGDSFSITFFNEGNGQPSGYRGKSSTSTGGEPSQTAAIGSCENCMRLVDSEDNDGSDDDDTTTAVCFCLSLAADNTTYALSYDEGCSGTYTSVDTSALDEITIGDQLALQLELGYNSSSDSIAADWVRFNIGATTCPSGSTVE